MADVTSFHRSGISSLEPAVVGRRHDSTGGEADTADGAHLAFDATVGTAAGRATPYPQARASSRRVQRGLLLGALVIGDAAALATAFALAYWLRFDMQFTLAPEVVPLPTYYPGLSALLIPLWLAMFAAFTLYDPLSKLGGIVESSRTFHACTVATMLVVVGTFFFPAFVVSRAWLIGVWLSTSLLVAVNRFMARRAVYAARRRGYLLRPAVIVGTNQEALNLHAFLADWQSSGVRTVGFVGTGRDKEPPAVALLGTSREIRSIVEQHDVEDVIVAITAIRREELLRLCEELDPLPVELRLSSGLYEMLTTRVTVRTLGTVPLLNLQKNRLHQGETLIKTLLDFSLVSAALLLLWPLLAAIALWIKLDSPGPVFHRRRVLGAGGRPFDAFKFRTMHVNGDELLAQQPDAARLLREHHKLKRDPRVTRAGQWLRTFSLDELPQFFNVLLGQMSLVGPRMITEPEAKKYGRHRLALLSVKPGITGLWQVSGRSDLSYAERVRIDMYYVRNYSVWIDLQILFIQTLPAVLKGRGAY